jgi:hypothetical protein
MEEYERRFTGPDGEFVSTFEKKDGTVSIGFLEELLEWVYFHNNKEDSDKLKEIEGLENMIQKMLDGEGDGKPRFGIKGTYVRTWSIRLKKDIDEKTEKISIDVLIDDLKTNERFKCQCEDESPKWAMMVSLRNTIDFSNESDEERVYEFPKGKEFMLVNSYSEKGDEKDEQTAYGLFVRISDDKLFEINVHDAGFIGPSTLTMSDHLEDGENKWFGKYEKIDSYKYW